MRKWERTKCRGGASDAEATGDGVFSWKFLKGMGHGTIL